MTVPLPTYREDALVRGFQAGHLQPGAGTGGALLTGTTWITGGTTMVFHAIDVC